MAATEGSPFFVRVFEIIRVEKACKKQTRKKERKRGAMHFDYTFCYCEENVYRFCERVAAAKLRRGAADELPPLLNRIADPLTDIVAVIMSSLHIVPDDERANEFQPSQIAVCAGPTSTTLQGKTSAPDFVLWDYHVIAMFCVDAPDEAGGGTEWWAVDFDTKWPVTPATCVELGTFTRNDTGRTCTLVAWPLLQYLVMTLFPLAVPKATQGRNDLAVLEDINANRLRLRLVPAAAYLSCLRTDRSHMLRGVPRQSKAPLFVKPPPPQPPIQGASSEIAQLAALDGGGGICTFVALDEKARENAGAAFLVARRTPLGVSNLVSFLNMDRSFDFGLVCTRDELVKREVLDALHASSAELR